MNKDKSKSYQDSIKLWLVKAALVFSVFCFSGFNQQIHSTVNSSIKIEIAESRTHKPAYFLEKNTKDYNKLRLASPLAYVYSLNIWAIINHDNILNSKFKSYRDRIILSSLSSIEVLFKLPSSSSQDETPIYKS